MGIRGSEFEKFADEVSGEFCRWENFAVQVWENFADEFCR
jgi:hypothetical protein